MSVYIKKIPHLMFNTTSFWFLCAGIVVLAIGYVYFVNAIVWNVAERQQSERRLSEMTAKIAVLESEYMALTSSISVAEAYNLGFKNTPAADTSFIKKSATLGALTRKVQ